MRVYKAGELLELSLRFEQTARDLYQKWTEQFAAVPDVAAFWRSYAEEETSHSALLEGLRARLRPQQLEGPIQSDLVEDVRRLLVSLQKAVPVQDLDQAYRFANMVEHSEANSLFELVMSVFTNDEKAIPLLRSQLEEHVSKLTYKFPKQFATAELRRAIKVVP